MPQNAFGRKKRILSYFEIGILGSKTDTEKYLGDLISSDGSNKKNIQARKEKGIGIVSQIMGILEGTIYGPYYFEVGLILRSSLLVNSIF